ncbi:MAG TPA: tRNA (N6-isopentenyl adenosine(37)-C2)-methylthiotransferase MiaB [Clostridiaceae bacterium]|nr:tRNA (N6-isopentenyl adenosine(37)-C2)-methylthiotransferase MiaB [Clostridiaceae bacterium]
MNNDLYDKRTITESGFDEQKSTVKEWSDSLARETGRAPSYFVRTFGCQQNDRDSELAAGIFEEMGFHPAVSPDVADVVLFNTCSVRANADNRFYGHLGNLKPIRKGGRPIIGVFGCMMEQEVHVDTIKQKFPYVDFILGAGDVRVLPYALVETLSDGTGKRKTLDLTTWHGLGDDTSLPVLRADPHRALVTIMTGCNNFCSYCIVPYTRGREISRAYEKILDEARRAVELGAKEIMLLGQNVNSYGNDLRKRGEVDAPTFAELLRDISHLDGLWVVRYMTSHPKDLSDELIAVISREPRVESHIHLPLQSGSDAILRRMNRRYDAAHYLDLVRKLRSCRNGITITTDLIVGFPSETEEDFQQTLHVMEEARFDAAFTFLYSPRVGTPAADWFDESQHEVVRERFMRLVEYQNECSLASNKALEGQVLDVLVDGKSRRDETILSGRTHDDRLVNFAGVLSGSSACQKSWPNEVFDSARIDRGDIVRVLIERANVNSLDGIQIL